MGIPRGHLSVTPERAMYDLPAGTTLGKYEVLRKIATGGMAEIYLARVRGTAGFEKLVVLKRILPNVAEDPTFVQMFLDEARLAATLQHPNIADVYDVGDDAGAPFFAMEFVHGQDVRSIRMASKRANQPIPLSIALAITHGLAAALDYAHDKKSADGKLLNVVHRDVSASNVIVSYDGAIKLLDFGIARATNRTHKTQVGTLKGKIPYMSPEQCRGFELDRRSDLFSLGIVMYELTVHRRPFRGESDFELMDQIVNKGAQPPSQVMRDFPPELEAIIMKLLAMKAADRYQSAEEMIHDLEPFLSQHRLWVSSKPLGRYMKSLFEDRIAAWELAQQDGVPLSQHVAATITSQSQQSELLTPPSAFPGLKPLSQEMPAAMVSAQMAAVSSPVAATKILPNPTPIPTKIPARAESIGIDITIDSKVSQTVYPELRPSRLKWFVILGLIAVALGGGIAVLANNSDSNKEVVEGTTPEEKPSAVETDPATKPATEPTAKGTGGEAGETKPVTETKPAVETKPGEPKPVAETKPTVETKPGETKPGETKPETKPPGEPKPTVETKPSVTKLTVETKPKVEPKPRTKPVIKPPVEPKPVVKPKDTKPKGGTWDPNSPFLPGT